MKTSSLSLSIKLLRETRLLLSLLLSLHFQQEIKKKKNKILINLKWNHNL